MFGVVSMDARFWERHPFSAFPVLCERILFIFCGFNRDREG